ncbi:CPBP family intramembrane metalloprotease [Trebonia kvetii]|uniref:CPBP family intramembrane metalloprotease n=1 Tax=Trebonia kvetii TaxID=2480626 RepID=A0A6P2C664_9ACTN|nr:CPBP family intramembrane glutamic endopeptidase [Trebonia kvetii]TVZ06487.1 CPBP family intramembrane metalloprotease [Trebonia kvetii]
MASPEDDLATPSVAEDQHPSSRTVSWLRLTRPTDSPELSWRERVLLRWEIVAVFAVSLGASGVYAFVSLIGSLTARHSLASQQVTLNGSQAPGRPVLDLFLQLVSLASGAAPVILAFYLLARSGDGAKSIGVDRTQPLRDFLRGAALAALIGGSGLGLYFIAYKSGIAVNIVAENLPNIWWRFPVLVLSALQNGVLEEVLVTGYLLTRLRQLGVHPWIAILISATLRGSYHLYQGFGGFIGNAVMGLIFGTLFLRWRRVLPMIIAHTLIDGVAFIGYALLAGHVSWLP